MPLKSITDTPPTGWLCPCCKVVWAPTVQSCRCQVVGAITPGPVVAATLPLGETMRFGTATVGGAGLDLSKQPRNADDEFGTRLVDASGREFGHPGIRAAIHRPIGAIHPGDEPGA